MTFGSSTRAKIMDNPDKLMDKVQTIIAIRNRLNSLTGATLGTPQFVDIPQAKKLYEDSLKEPVVIVTHRKSALSR